MNPVILRNHVLPLIRDYFLQLNIHEALTPLGVKSGGIEPYIDPVRLGEDYYLPTSPEISLKKQLSMYPDTAKGIYEIAHAFRDEAEGAFHLREFTMVEWYLRQTGYIELITGVLNIIKTIGAAKPETSLLNIKDIQQPRVYSVSDIFEQAFKTRLEPAMKLEDYLEIAKKTVIKDSALKTAQDLSPALAIVEVFTLLYDNAITDCRENFKGLIFVKEYPSFLRGMARLSDNGWAMRIEGLFNGVELCSGYQEEHNTEELLKIWNDNNLMRTHLNKPVHPVDYQLLEILPQMKGVSGMAMGLERVIMSIHGIRNITGFKTDPF